MNLFSILTWCLEFWFSSLIFGGDHLQRFNNGFSPFSVTTCNFNVYSNASSVNYILDVVESIITIEENPFNNCV